EIQAITNLLNLYRTAIVQEDIDRLQELLQPENALSQQVTAPPQNNSRQEGQGVAVDVRTFREAMSEAFRTVDFLDLLIPEGETHITSDRQRVTFLEMESVEDPVALVQRTRAFYTTFNLTRDVAGTTTTFRIAAMTRDGPIAQITTPGRIVAGTPT